MERRRMSHRSTVALFLAIAACLTAPSLAQGGDGLALGSLEKARHVPGAAALYAASHPFATAAEIKAAILGSATPTSSLYGKCVTGGRLNVGGF